MNYKFQRMLLILLTYFQLCKAQAFGEIYQWTDSDGAIHFSDSTERAPSRAHPVIRQEEQTSSPSDSIPTAPSKQFFKEGDKHGSNKIKKNGLSDQLDPSYKLTSEEKQYLYLILKEFKISKSDTDKLVSHITTRGDLKSLMQYLQYLDEGIPFDISVITNAPDPNFASPETTWDLYRKSFIQGKLEVALKCLSPGCAHKQSQMFQNLSKDVLNVMGNQFGPIQKVMKDAETAKYRIKRDEHGRQITYYVQFVNIFGNWKIDSL